MRATTDDYIKRYSHPEIIRLKAGLSPGSGRYVRESGPTTGSRVPGELLCAIEEDREPANSARRNLPSLQICFAAVASADLGKPVCPAGVKAVPSRKEP